MKKYILLVDRIEYDYLQNNLVLIGGVIGPQQSAIFRGMAFHLLFALTLALASFINDKSGGRIWDSGMHKYLHIREKWLSSFSSFTNGLFLYPKFVTLYIFVIISRTTLTIWTNDVSFCWRISSLKKWKKSRPNPSFSSRDNHWNVRLIRPINFSINIRLLRLFRELHGRFRRTTSHFFRNFKR